MYNWRACVLGMSSKYTFKSGGGPSRIVILFSSLYGNSVIKWRWAVSVPGST